MPVFSDDSTGSDIPFDSSNWGVQSVPQDNQDNDESSAQDTWDRIHDQTIDKKYGSEDSPLFLNREEMNPNEQDYDYGTPAAE